MRILPTLLAAMLLAAPSMVRSAQHEAPKPKPDRQLIERGRYLAVVGGCSDCHTAGYAEAEGKLPEGQWLKGNPVGYRGIWGTTYATNLRISLAQMPEDQWLTYAKALETRPPMPWFNLNQWSDEDLRAFYHYVRYLGASGRPSPEPVPPHEEPKGATVNWPLPAPSASIGSQRPAPATKP